MSYRGLLEYIRRAKDIGASDAEITQRLHAAGWYDVDVRDALELYRKLTANTNGGAYEPMAEPPHPSLSERVLPRHYDRHLIAIAVVCFALGYCAYVLLIAR